MYQDFRIVFAKKGSGILGFVYSGKIASWICPASIIIGVQISSSLQNSMVPGEVQKLVCKN